MAKTTNPSLASIRAALDDYAAAVSDLPARVARIGEELAALEREVAALESSGSVRAPRRGRPAGAVKPRGRHGKAGGGRRAPGMDLASIIAKVLAASKEPMGIPAIVAAVKRAGYASSSPSFARIVGMRLGDRRKFRRVGRGMYTAAGGGGGAKANPSRPARKARKPRRAKADARKPRASKAKAARPASPPKPEEPKGE